MHLTNTLPKGCKHPKPFIADFTKSDRFMYHPLEKNYSFTNDKYPIDSPKHYRVPKTLGLEKTKTLIFIDCGKCDYCCKRKQSHYSTRIQNEFYTFKQENKDAVMVFFTPTIAPEYEYLVRSFDPKVTDRKDSRYWDSKKITLLHQQFIKRWQKGICFDSNSGVRYPRPQVINEVGGMSYCKYFCVVEYGEESNRIHLHYLFLIPNPELVPLLFQGGINDYAFKLNDLGRSFLNRYESYRDELFLDTDAERISVCQSDEDYFSIDSFDRYREHICSTKGSIRYRKINSDDSQRKASSLRRRLMSSGFYDWKSFDGSFREPIKRSNLERSLELILTYGFWHYCSILSCEIADTPNVSSYITKYVNKQNIGRCHSPAIGYDYFLKYDVPRIKSSAEPIWGISRQMDLEYGYAPLSPYMVKKFGLSSKKRYEYLSGYRSFEFQSRSNADYFRHTAPYDEKEQKVLREYDLNYRDVDILNRPDCSFDLLVKTFERSFVTYKDGKYESLYNRVNSLYPNFVFESLLNMRERGYWSGYTASGNALLLELIHLAQSLCHLGKSGEDVQKDINRLFADDSVFCTVTKVNTVV